MGRSQRISDQSIVWLRDLIQTIDRVAASKAKASRGEVKALARRLELPALAVMADPLNRLAIYRLGNLQVRPPAHLPRRAQS
jgi:hypothetical protein